MSNVMISKSDFTITVKKDGGRITSTGPITVKNQIEEIRSLDDIPGVNTALKTDGATIVYNAATGQYDVKSYNEDPYLEVTDLYIERLHANNSLGTNGQVLFTNGNTAYWANGVTKITAGPGITGGGTGENVLISVNTAFIATITSNNTLFAYGKRELDLSVNFATFAGNSNFSFTANNSTFAYSKLENALNVNSAVFATLASNSNFSLLSNNSTFAYGKRESDLFVNFATFAGNSNFSFTANNSTHFNGRPGSFYTNATNISTGTLSSERLPNTSVVPGVYGNTSQLAIITVDQYGRINAISTSAVAGVNNYNYSSSNNTFSITTGDGSTFNATIDTVKDFTVTGNLTVSGTTTTVNTENLTVKDPVIRLNDGQVTPFNDIGILMQRYAVANSTNYNVAIAWDEATRELKFGKTPENGSDSDISFSNEWVRFDELGNAYIAQDIEAGNNISIGGSLTVNNVTITELLYPGTANNSTYAYGKTENVLNVNSAVYATNSQFAYTANNSVYAYGKTENVLNVNSSVYAVNSEFAYLANNSAHAYGKTEAVLNVNSAVFSTNAIFAYTANDSVHAYGKTEAVLNVNSAVYSTNALYSNNALYLNNKPEEYYTNATNITTGVLAEPHLPFRMDQNVRKIDNVEFHNLVITGNVSITGNTTIISSNNISTTDNMFYLNANSFNTNPDIGFVANYNDGIYHHTGFFRDASDGIWKVFDSYLPEPGTFIDTANDSFHIADFQANTAYFKKIDIGNSSVFTTISDGLFTGTTNNATYAYGKTEGVLNVNSAVFSTNATFAYTANNSTFAYGKTEDVLNVNSSIFSTNATFAYTANNSTFAYGKTEGVLNVNSAIYANNSTFAYGKTEGVLNVNSAVFAVNTAFAFNANNSALLNGFNDQYFTNATNISTGTLASERLPNTSVVVGTYGNSSSIPVITVDQYGRLTNVSTSAVAGVTDYSYSSGNNTFSIATGDGSTFKATISTVNDFTVTGNLTVSGTTTSVNTQNITVKDAVIRLNDGQLTPFNDIGILMQRFAAANSTNYNVAFAWDEGSREFKFGKTPEDGSDSDISFSQEWLRVDENGNVYSLQNIESGNTVKVTTALVINNATITEVSYPGNANTATFFNGIIDEGTY